MTLSATNEAIASAQAILEAVQQEASIAHALNDGTREGRFFAQKFSSFDQQNILRAQLVSHAWRKIGRQVLAMHPEIVEEVRIATSDKVPVDVLRTLPYMNPMVVFSQPPRFNSWLPKNSAHPLTGQVEHGMRLLGFFTYGMANVRTEAGIEQRIYATNAPEAEKFGMMLILEALDENDKPIDMEFNSMTMPFGAEMTLAEVVDDLMSRFHWATDERGHKSNTTKNKRWMRSVLSVAIGSLFYLCSTTLEAEEVPRSYTAKRVPKTISRKPLSMFKIGWTTGAALTRHRQRRLAGWKESEQGDLGHQQDPQHRRAHFKMQPYGPGKLLRKLIFVSAYWTHVERLGEMGVNTARNVPRTNGKGSARESVRTALNVVPEN